MLRSKLLLFVVTGFAFVASSQAGAYPLDPDTVIWPFEGHGSDAYGGPVHTFSGQLTTTLAGTRVTATADGTATLLDGLTATAVVDTASLDFLSSGPSPVDFLSFFTSIPPFVSHPAEPRRWGAVNLGVEFRDQDGVALDGGFLDSHGSFLPP